MAGNYTTYTVEEYKKKLMQEEPQEASPVEALPQRQAPQVYTVKEYKKKLATPSVEGTGSSLPNTKVISTTSNGIYDVDSLLKEYGRPLVKQDFLDDERLQNIMRTYMRTRFSNPQQRSMTEKGYRAATWIAGGSTGGIASDFDQMDPEELFETFQNHQRSFAGGQSITTVNELGAVMQGDDATRAALGAGYTVFDAMDNAFIGAGTWAETGDAILDYGKAALWDPTTILTLGIGKAISAGSTKAGSLAFKQIAKTSLKTLVEKGASKAAASKVVGAAAKAAPFYAAEMLQNVAVDAAYQKSLLDTGAQEEYSMAQTGLVAAGSMVFPALMGAGALAKYGRSKLGAKNMLNYSQVQKYLDTVPPADRASQKHVDEVWKIMKEGLEFHKVVDAVDDTFGSIKGDPTILKPWKEALEISRDAVDDTGTRMTDTQALSVFEKLFLFGNPDAGKKGYYVALKEAGFSVHPYMVKDQKISGVLASTIEWLDDSVVSKAIKDFEDATGNKLGFTNKQEFADHFRTVASDAGSILQTRSFISRLENKKLTPDEIIQELANVTKPEKAADPKTMQFMMSTYKRLLTSHLATTGANIKGFAQLTSLNAAADVYTSVLSYGLGATHKLFGNADEAARHFRRGYGAMAGVGLRVSNAISPDVPMKYADEILERFPEIQDKLFREMSGDAGARESFKLYNLDPEGKLWPKVDGMTKAAQTLSMVRLQDDVTKRWAFGNSVDTYIMQEYGVNPTKFYSRPDLAVEMNSSRFKNNVLDKALNRTLRETASLNWRSLPANTAARHVAHGIEWITNSTPVGFIVPFGSFMNTTMATMGDLTTVNFFRALAAKATGKQLDYATQDTVELAAKGLVGITAIGLYVGHERQKIYDGLAWNQEDRGDGSVADVTFDWPGSTIHLMGAILAHGIPEGGTIADFDRMNVPKDLITEFAKQSGGQALRDFDDTLTAVEKLVTGLVTGVSVDYEKEFATLFARIPQAAMRPLDPVNNLVGVLSGDEMNPDRRQGPVFVNEAFRYVDHIFRAVGAPVPLQEPRARAGEGTTPRTDLGKQVLGVRSTTPDTLYGKMLNSAGMADWKAVTWDGPPELKNRLDMLITPILEERAITVLGQNPDFYKMSTERKEFLIKSKIIEPSKKVVMGMLENGGLPPMMDAVRQVALLDKAKVAKVKQFLGVTGDVVDISKQPDGFETLQKIIYFTKNYDDVFLNSLSNQ